MDQLKKLPPSFYNLVGQVATAGWQWLLTIWLVRFFGVRELGIFSYILAVVSPLLLFSNFQLRNRLVAQPGLMAKIPSFLRLRLFTISASVLIAGLWVLSAQADVDVLLLVGVLAFKSLEAWAELLHGVLQAEGKLTIVAGALGLKALMALVLMASATQLQTSSGAFFVALSLAYVGVSFAVEWKHADAVRGAQMEGAWQVLKQDPHLISLGAVAWLGSLSASWPRYLLQHNHGMVALGEFTAVFAIYAALGVVLNAWLQGMILPLSKAARPLSVMLKLVLQISAYHVVALAVLIPWGVPFLELMFGRVVVWPRQDVILLLTLSFAAGLSTVFYYYLLTIQKMGRQWMVMVGANLLVMGVGQQLIPHSPLTGGVLALLAGAGFQLVCYVAMSFSSLMTPKPQVSP